MYPDVVDLREFYESDLGQLAQRLIRTRLRELWPGVQGLSLLGLGYATPYLRPFLGEAQRVIALMPGQQGVTWWPREGPNLTTLTEETALPLPDQAMDRVLLVHSLENTEHIGDLLQEASRVLATNGKMMLVVPNRGGWWARDSRTPFGFGFSFTLQHARRILSHNRFQVERHARALFTPPFAYPLLAKSVNWIERQGNAFLPGLAGVLLMEVSKQVFARPMRVKAVVEKQRISKSVLLPMAEPTPTRAVLQEGV